MISIIFWILLTCFMIPRFALLSFKKKSNLSIYVKYLLITVIQVLPQFACYVVFPDGRVGSLICYSIVSILFINSVLFVIELSSRNSKWIAISRPASFIVYSFFLAISSVLLFSGTQMLIIPTALSSFISTYTDIIHFNIVSLQKLSLWLSGLIIVTGELNLVFYLILMWFGVIKVIPYNLPDACQQLEQERLSESTSLLIGLLERIIFFTFFISGHYEAVGFVVAAKAVTRFSATENDKGFSAYVLSGTLLSLVLSLAVATCFKYMLHTI